MRRTWWMLVGGLALFGPACAHRPPGASGASGLQEDSVTVHVTNHLSSQVVVFATAGPTHSHRMGYVDPGTSKDFVVRFPWLFGRGVQFEANGMLSGYLTLTPGDIVDWELGERPSPARLRS